MKLGRKVFDCQFKDIPDGLTTNRNTDNTLPTINITADEHNIITAAESLTPPNNQPEANISTFPIYSQ